MEGLVLILALAALSPIVAVIALLQASAANRSVTELRARLGRAMDELQALQAQVAASAAASPSPRAAEAAPVALLLLFGYVTLEVRHAFQGEWLSIWRPSSAPEVWTYSAAWLALGLGLLLYGLWRGSREPRLASAALLVLTVLKVFLYDLTGLGGFWRAFSVICLGAVLIGIGLLYQKLVFARPRIPASAPELSPGATD